MSGSILARRDRVSLGSGFDLRLLSALELLQARQEGAALAADRTTAPSSPTGGRCWRG